MDWHARARGRTKSSLWRRVDADVPARVESATLLSGSRFVSFRVQREGTSRSSKWTAVSDTGCALVRVASRIRSWIRHGLCVYRSAPRSLRDRGIAQIRRRTEYPIASRSVTNWLQFSRNSNDDRLSGFWTGFPKIMAGWIRVTKSIWGRAPGGLNGMVGTERRILASEFTWMKAIAISYCWTMYLYFITFRCAWKMLIYYIRFSFKF